MRVRFIGSLLAFALILGVVALRPGAIDTAVAVLQTETPTITNTPVNTNTSTATTTASTTATVTRTPTVTSTPGPSLAAVRNYPEADCIGGFPPTSANVTFTWTGPTNVSNIYLDVSVFDNSFQDGTYITIVLPAGATSFKWNGLQAGIAHFWRVTGQGLSGDWSMSDFGSFVPCGRQVLLNLSYNCTGGGRATVTFRWAPSAGPGFFQFLDLSLFNNGFIPGTFLGAGPLPGTQQALVWQGILANAVHYYRVNAFTVFGWAPAVGSFVPSCPF